MSEMVERVAKAMWAERVRHAKEINGLDLYDYEADGNGVEGEARAAIAAMRDADLSEMRVLLHSGAWDSAEELWKAVLDAALQSSESDGTR